MDQALVTRRMLIKDMGTTGMAVIVLGLAACSEGTTDEATSTERQDGVPETLISDPSHDPYDWRRVSLGFVSAYVLYRRQEAVVVDTGVEGSETSIEAALGEIGVGWDRVSTVIVTHKHPDHQGSIEAVLELAPQASVIAGSSDIPSITTDREITPMFDEQSINNLQIIETPGHTPGHISVLDPVAGILVAGDALIGANGGVVGPDPEFTEDMTAANTSAMKLAGFEYEVALFGHGEPVLEAASDLVAELAETLGGG